jgi:hypothetical protein
MAGAITLDQVFSGLAADAEFFERLPRRPGVGGAGGHGCLIPPNQRGNYTVR